MPKTNEYRIEVEPTSYGRRIELPNREVGTANALGWILVAFGCVVMLFMISWIAGPATIGIEMLLDGQRFGYLLLAFGMLGLWGLFMSVKILAAGIAIVRNRVGCEVRITDRKLISKEKFAWFSHNIKVDLEKIDSLFIRPVCGGDLGEGGGSTNVSADWFAQRLPADWHGIATEQRNGLLIAAGYPCEILLPLAELIKSEIDRNRVGNVSIVDFARALNTGPDNHTIQQPVAIVRQSAEEVEAVPVELPVDSLLEVSDENGATVYRIPAKGVWRGSHGLLFFGILWNGFMAFITVCMLVGNGDADGGVWVLVLMLALFWTVGIGIVVGAFYLGCQSALIGVREELLFVERKTIFGTRWTEFEPGDITSVHVGPSNVEVNDEPLMELKVQRAGKPAVGMFSQLDVEECLWLAQQLRKQLNLDLQSANSWRRYLDPDNPLAAPESSQIVAVRSTAQTLITIPKKNIEGHWMLLLMGLGFAVGSIPAAIFAFLFVEDSLIFIPIAAIGTLMGALMLIVDRIYSTRWFELTVDDSQISIKRHGFLSEYVKVIAKESVKRVVLKDSGTKVNGRTYMLLAVDSLNRSESFSLMSGHDEREIAYVAALIHDAMGLVEGVT